MKADLSNLWIFGSIAYTNLPKELRNKMDMKTCKNIFKGCAVNGATKGEQIIIARDIIFDENILFNQNQPLILVKKMVKITEMPRLNEEDNAEDQQNQTNENAEDQRNCEHEAMEMNSEQEI